MEYGSRRLSCCLAMVAAVLLSCSGRPAAEISAAQQFIVPQSHLRAINGLRPLKWSNELADRAARWAAQYAGDCAAASWPSSAPPGAGVGVNVFRGYGGGSWQPSDAVTAWAEEAQHYDYWSNSCAAGMECGQYKQMVWRGSTEVGCATVACASGETLMTCHYEPQGNMMGQKPF